MHVGCLLADTHAYLVKKWDAHHEKYYCLMDF